jgi:hypothetical protein
MDLFVIYGVAAESPTTHSLEDKLFQFCVNAIASKLKTSSFDRDRDQTVDLMISPLNKDISCSRMVTVF